MVWEYFFSSCDDEQEKKDIITQIMVVPTKISEEKHVVESLKEEGTVIMVLL